jgi:hypothetical protein
VAGGLVYWKALLLPIKGGIEMSKFIAEHIGLCYICKGYEELNMYGLCIDCQDKDIEEKESQ